MKEDSDHRQKVTNLDYLIELSKGNTQFVKDMIKIFLEENPVEMEIFEKAIKDRDFEAIRACAHKLRSSVPFVGIDKIVENEISEIETLAAENAIPQKIEIVTEIADIKKIEILKVNSAAIGRIELLFKKIKDTCNTASEELSTYDFV